MIKKIHVASSSESENSSRPEIDATSALLDLIVNQLKVSVEQQRITSEMQMLSHLRRCEREHGVADIADKLMEIPDFLYLRSDLISV